MQRFEECYKSLKSEDDLANSFDEIVLLIVAKIEI